MGPGQIREKLHDYINKADERLLNLMFAMAQADMQGAGYDLSDSHKEILDQRLASHEANLKEGSSWDEVKSRISKQL